MAQRQRARMKVMGRLLLDFLFLCLLALEETVFAEVYVVIPDQNVFAFSYL
jgi:hypothetical protein